MRLIKFGWTLAAILAVTSYWSCVDLEFDKPPVGNLPTLAANGTIAELKSKHTIGNTPSVINDDLVVAGIVVGDDRSGNIFKNIMVQDATAGIAIRLNSTGLYNDFPVGSKVAVRCQGLYIGDYNGLYQLSGSPDSEIEEVLIPEHVIRIADDNSLVIQPRVVTIDELSNNTLTDQLLNTLIQLEDVQFIGADTSVTYADAVNKFSVNRTLQDCNGKTIIVRSSGYADFATATTPSGKGTVTALLSIFGNTRQLTLRDLNDVALAGARCGGGSSGGDLIDIKSLRDLFVGGATTGPTGKKIQGVAISDKNTMNVDTRNLYIQDATGGVVVRFTAAHNFNLGDKVEVDVAGQSLSEFNGLLQVNVANERALAVGTSALPTPRNATIAEVLANLDNWESTLVKITDVTLSGGATYSGSRTAADASGSMVLFTRTQATFANDALPTGTVTLTAIVSQFTDGQLIIRSPGDVSGGGTGGTPELINISDLRAIFTGATTSAPSNKKIKGVVISDKDNLNWPTANLVIQDGTAGITVRFTAAHSFNLGDEIEVNVSGQELSEYNGLLEVNNVPAANGALIGAGTLPAPRLATIAEIIANAEAWECTLVKVVNVTFTDGGTYSGSKNLSDGTGNIITFTRTQATFAATNVPTTPVTLVAVVSPFNDPQLIIRNTSDVTP